MNAACEGCRSVHDVGARLGWKLGLGMPAMLMGARFAQKNPWLGVGFALLGLALGHYADQNILPQCPTCGRALQLVELVAQA